MAFAAITFRVKPEHEKEVVDIFTNFKRASSPIVYDDEGNEVAWILGTGIFYKDGSIVRVIHYEGSLEHLRRHMGAQSGVQEAEHRLNDYLEVPRDTTSEERFREFFEDSLMRRVSQLSSPTEFVVDVLKQHHTA
jgi:hypothetical protein